MTDKNKCVFYMKRINKCRALKEMLCDSGDCKFFACNKYNFIRKKDLFVCHTDIVEPALNHDCKTCKCKCKDRKDGE